MHTPATVHDGTAARIQAHRAATLQAAFQAHPERFRGRCPSPPPLPDKVWINPPPEPLQTHNETQTAHVA